MILKFAFLLILLKLALVVIIVYDWKWRIIPNYITYTLFFSGFLWYSFYFGWTGFKFAFWGSVIGGGIFLIFYLSGGMGAGDIKLLSGIGAILGVKKMIYVIVLTSLLGGILSIIFIFRTLIVRYNAEIKLYKKNRWSFRNLIQNIRQSIQNESIPYGIAIAIGTMIALCIS
ncbi:prepilin peptidase [candidate division KSB1 bacterium]|nr:prepilin peptidase [candidate division KSB1 bacterium]